MFKKKKETQKETKTKESKPQVSKRISMEEAAKIIEEKALKGKGIKFK